MTKFGIFAWFSYSLPIEERLRMIKKTGFDAASLWWGSDDRDLQPEIARNLGLDIDNIHVPFNGPDNLWLDNIDGEEYLRTLITSVNDCARHSISTAVVHITGFHQATEITNIGIERIKKLVDAAESKNIYLAFENLNFLQHLDYIFENIKSEYLGFCYDSGHENCNHPEVDCLSRYGDKLFAVHLDDNLGDKDTHLLPFDGTANWIDIMNKLKKCREIEYLTLEVDFNKNHEKGQMYKDLSAEDFLVLAYKSLEKLSDI